MRLDAPYIVENGQPGQFVMVRAGAHPEKGGGPLLKRPFSIHRLGPGDEISLLYHKVGVGSALLAGMADGERTELFGPLGRGFRLEKLENPYLVAGGIGLAPFLTVCDRLIPNSSPKLLFGARSAAEVPPEEHWAAYECDIHFATDDGSVGYHGFVTGLLEDMLVKKPGPVLACGPTPMMAATAKLAEKYGVACQVSLEAHMACGMGACLGCVVKKSGSKTEYARVCMDGPVMDAEVVSWP